MPMPETLREKIQRIAGEDGFYKSDCEETFVEAAVQLMFHGFSEDGAISFLGRLYSAVADEYGD